MTAISAEARTRQPDYNDDDTITLPGGGGSGHIGDRGYHIAR